MLDICIDGEDAVASHRRLAEQRGGRSGATAGGGDPHLDVVGALERGSAKHTILATFHSVARWQNLIASSPWIAPGWRVWGSQILQCSVAEP